MNLPPCHSRRIIDANSTQYFCAHPQHHSKDNVVTLEICNVCPLWQEPPPEKFRLLPKEWPPKPRELCVFLAEQIGLRDCPTCQGMVRVKVFACGHPAHRETTLAECAECPDHQNRQEKADSSKLLSF
jgi:hypothetical protein